MSNERNYVYFNGTIYSYRIKFSDKTNKATIKVDDDLKIVVVANPYFSHQEIQRFVDTHIEKVLEIIERKKNSDIFIPSKNEITILNNTYKIVVERAFGNENFKLIKNTLYLYLKSNESREKVLRRFLKKQANDIIIPRAKELMNKYKFPQVDFQIKWLTATWGLCSRAKKSISFSSRLVCFSQEVIDYVIIHELAHLYQPNHSTEFWNVVEQFIPNYKYLRKSMRY